MFNVNVATRHSGTSRTQVESSSDSDSTSVTFLKMTRPENQKLTRTQTRLQFTKELESHNSVASIEKLTWKGCWKNEDWHQYQHLPKFHYNKPYCQISPLRYKRNPV